MPKGHRVGGGLVGKSAANVGVSRHADVVPYIAFTVTANGSGSITNTGNGTDTQSYTKSGTQGWDTQVYCGTAFTKPITIECNKNASYGDDGQSYSMIGWNTDPTTDASYSSLDHAIYPYYQALYAVYHNGSQVGGGGTWSPSNKFYIVYSADGYIRHWNGSRLMYSANYGSNTVYLDSSFYSPYSNSAFTNVRITKREWNGIRYV